MDGTIQAYVLDMAADTKKEPLRVKQYDTNSRQARITLKMGGEPWTIPFGCQIYINVRKIDGKLADATCTREDEHTVLAPITEQMTAVTGTQLGELYFLGSDGDIKTQTFPVVVYEAVMDQARIESSDDFQSLQEALRDVKASTDTADIAAQYATEQGNSARDGAQRANDAADSIQVAVDAAAAAKASETNAKTSETAAAQTQQEVTDYVEAQKAAFVGYSQRESDSKYANALTETAMGEGGVTVEDAWTAPVLNLEVAGKSEQVVTTGAQLFDAGKVTGATAGGATVTNNGDGSFTVSGSGAMTNNINQAILFTRDQTLTILRAGNYCISGKKTYPYFYYTLYNTAEKKVVFEINTKGTPSKEITEELINNENVVLRIGFYGEANTQIIPGVVWLMVNAGDTALSWEPYTGGAPSPSPDYPQNIISVGTVSTGAQLLNADTIVQGMISTETGAESESPVFVRSDYIPVKPGDYILSGDGLKPYFNHVMYFNQEKVIQSSLAIKPTNGKFTVADETAYIRIRFISKDGTSGTVTPSEVSALKPMLNAGDTALPWEPYTGGKPSPSVEYPQTLNIHSAVGNRNLLKKSGIPITTNSYFMKSYFFGDIKPVDGETYTIQVKGKLGTGKTELGIFNSGGSVWEMKFYPNDRGESGIYTKTFVWKIKNNGNTAKNISLDVYAVPNSVDSVSTIEWIKLEKGELATPWVPAPEDITPENAEQYSDIIHAAAITLTEPLRGIGEYRDRIMCRDGVWGIERYWKSIMLDGNIPYREYNQLNVSKEIRANEGIIKIKPINGLFSNLKIVAVTWDNDKLGIGCFTSGPVSNPYRSISLRIPVDADVAEYMAANPTEVIYQPYEYPTWEPLPDATQQALNSLTTYTGTTHLTVTAGGPAPTVTLDYVKDTHKALEQCQEAAKEYTDNQIAAIVAALPTATQAAIVDNQTTKLLQEV